MLKGDVIRLVKTLSTTEKRGFKLFCKKQSGDRAYLTLFDLIDQILFKDIDQLEQKFRLIHPEASFETTVKYLLKVLTDSLVQAYYDKEPLFQQMQTFMRAKVLLDRSLTFEGLKELNKLQKLAVASQNYMMEYLAYREELTVLSDFNFPDTSDHKIIEMQMKGKNTLKGLLLIHEHHSLLESLKIRLLHQGNSLSEQSRQKLNDLLLSEMSLVTGKVAHNFESTKLHLLFQSFFFTSTGDYKSALKTFSELDRLFNQNLERLGSPPLDYLSSLEGILDSLRTMNAYAEMPFYIEKISKLIDKKYTEQFNTRALKTVITYQLVVLIGSCKPKEALAFLTAQDQLLFKETAIIDYGKHCELLFYSGLTYFVAHQWKKVINYTYKITLLGKSSRHFAAYKAAKLLNIITRYEMDDSEYLHYEIRAYKRPIAYKNEVLKIEKLIFKVIMIDPHKNSVVKNRMILKKLEPAMKIISNDKYEMQLLKYYNFISWIELKFRDRRNQVTGSTLNEHERVV